MLNGGTVEEIIADKGLEVVSEEPFKGDMDIAKLQGLVQQHGSEKIAFVRMEAGTNLIGGQPISLQNLREIRQVCDQHGLLLVLDASLLADNLYFLKQREASCQPLSIRAITRQLADQCDIIYFFGTQARLRARWRRLYSATRRCSKRCVAWCRCTKAS